MRAKLLDNFAYLCYYSVDLSEWMYALQDKNSLFWFRFGMRVRITEPLTLPDPDSSLGCCYSDGAVYAISQTVASINTAKTKRPGRLAPTWADFFHAIT